MAAILEFNVVAILQVFLLIPLDTSYTKKPGYGIKTKLIYAIISEILTKNCPKWWPYWNSKMADTEGVWVLVIL
jgi:hypothetical protein